MARRALSVAAAVVCAMAAVSLLVAVSQSDSSSDDEPTELFWGDIPKLMNEFHPDAARSDPALRAVKAREHRRAFNKVVSRKAHATTKTRAKPSLAGAAAPAAAAPAAPAPAPAAQAAPKASGASSGASSASSGASSASSGASGSSSSAEAVEDEPEAPESEWSYGAIADKLDPEQWGLKYSLCKVGKHQSPVNLDVTTMVPTFTDHDHSLVWNIVPSEIDGLFSRSAELANRDDSFEVDGLEAFLSWGGQAFQVENMVFKTPSEHHINGLEMPMELQITHRSADGHALAVSVLFSDSEGEDASFLRGIESYLPKAGEAEKRFPFTFRAVSDALTRSMVDYMSYEGSVTHPPCTEGVTWIVLAKPFKASPEQLFHLSAHFNNNRPLQPLHGRKVELHGQSGFPFFSAVSE